MPLLTRGFRTRRRLEDHYDDHHREVNATDEAHYVALADRFLGAPLQPGATVRECVRPLDGAVIRWDYVTQEFGILSSDGFIQSYYIANPHWHGFATNRAYFEYECRRQR